MYRILVPACCFAWCVAGLAALPSDQDNSDSQIQKLFDDSRARAESVEVKVTLEGRTTMATVQLNPLMKYTDVPRQIEMATLWVWHVDGRIAAVGKVEAYQRKDMPIWLYCFTSATTGLVDAKFTNGHHYRATKPGIKWSSMDGPAPAATNSGRLRQMKELFQRFTATARDDLLNSSEELRPLARPLHEYSSPKQGVIYGVLCGLTANGTNPDVIVALELIEPANEPGASKPWRYGIIGMTASGISVKLDRSEVYTRPYSRSARDFDNWTYFREDEPRK